MDWIFVAVVLLFAVSLVYYQLRTGVPPFPASKEESEAVVHLLRQTDLPPRPRVYELGCGWGGLALAIARQFPEAQVVGLELSWLPYVISRWRARKQSNLSIRRVDFHHHELDDADAVTAYLMIAPMIPLAEKLDNELKEGTPVVSVAFFFRDREPSAVVPGRGLFRGSTALYLWPASGEPKVEPLGGVEQHLPNTETG